MGHDRSQSISELLLVPLLVVLFACNVIGSFFLWRVSSWLHPDEAVAFDLHLFHGEDRDLRRALVACLVGLIALSLPVSLLVHAAG